jgi:hypothetical protein
MLRRDKTLLAGTIIAIPMWLLCAAAATSQSTLTNNQVQLGDVFSSQQLDVVTASSDTTAVTTATGNSLTGTVQNGDLDIQSQQTLSGQVLTATTVNVASFAGANTTMTTASTGNTGDAGIDSGGTLSGNFVQTSTSPGIRADQQLNADNAEADNIAFAVQAIGNSQGFGATDSAVNATVSQGNASDTIANGGAVVNFAPGDSSFSAAAVGNNVTSVGVGASTQTLGVTQTQSGGIVQGAQFTNLGDSQNTNTSATASGNNANTTNEQGAFTVGVNQDNQSFVHAQAVETSFEFGGASTSAFGVGNSTLAGNAGPSLVLNNTQLNGVGGVEATASFTGDNGFDAFTSATAMGNAATGFACSACGGVMSVHNSQTNQGDAAATVTTTLTSGARSVRGTANAVGNNGTFYVTKPGN